MDQNLADLKQKITVIENKIREELMTIRTGKASPSLVENISVLTYGGSTRLKILELAGISTTGPAHLVIDPYDVSTVTDIEKAILASPVHLTPRVDGKLIHIDIPPLSEEQRKDYLKLVAAKIEEGKERIRFYRDEIRKKTKHDMENKIITEDDKFRLEKEIDKITQEGFLRLEEVKNKKEKEIMAV